MAETMISVTKKKVLAKRIVDVVKTKNQERKFGAAVEYNHLRVQFPKGAERHLLFTDFIIKRAIERAKKNPEDLPRVSWLRDIIESKIVDSQRLGDIQFVKNELAVPTAAANYNFIRVEYQGDEIPLLFTDNEILVALKRANDNPEDLPRVSWLRDILD